MSHKYDSMKQTLHDACMLRAEEDLAEFPSDEEIARLHEFSPAFKRRMAEMMEECFHCRTKAEAAATRRRHLAAIKKFAAAAAVSVAFTFSCAMSVEAIRESFVQFIIRIYDDYLKVSFQPGDGKDASVMPDFILKYYEPSWIPEGYEKTGSKKTLTSFLVQYQSGEKFINYKQEIIDGLDNLVIDYDSQTGESYEIEGYGTYSFANGAHQLFWTDDSYFYLIQCDSTKDDLLRMAKSLRADDTVVTTVSEEDWVKDYYAPHWLPDGFLPRETEKLPGYHLERYINGEQEFTFLQCKAVDYMTSALSEYDLEAYEAEEIPNVGRFQYASGRPSLLSWKQDGYFCLLAGELPKETMIAVAESVK